MDGGHGPVVNKTEARSGESSGRIRWVLHIGMVLVVIAFAILLLQWI